MITTITRVAWIPRLDSTRTIWILIISRWCLPTRRFCHRFMMVRNRLNWRVDTGSLTRLIHGSGMIRVALSRWWPVPSDPTPVGIPARNICRWWLSCLSLIRHVFWIWLGKKLQIFLMINLLISAATATRRVIYVMIAAHVGCRRFVSHTGSRNMIRCGNIRA